MVYAIPNLRSENRPPVFITRATGICDVVEVKSQDRLSCVLGFECRVRLCRAGHKHLVAATLCGIGGSIASYQLDTVRRDGSDEGDNMCSRDENISLPIRALDRDAKPGSDTSSNEPSLCSVTDLSYLRRSFTAKIPEH